MIKRRQHRPAGTILRAVIILVASAAALLLAARFWIGPAILRSHIRDRLAEVWDGPVEINDVAFDLSGPLRIGRVELRDHAGRSWVIVTDLELTFRDWPSLSPVLVGCRAAGLTVRAHCDGERCDPPLRWPPEPPPDAAGTSDIEELLIERVSFGAVADGAGELLWPDLTLRAAGSGNHYDLSLAPLDDDGPGPRLTGTFDADTGELEARLALSRRLDDAEALALLRALGLAALRRAHGHARGEIRIAGRPAEPASLHAAGTLDLTGWEITPAAGPPLSDLRGALTFAGRHVQAQHVTARTCGGSLAGAAELRLPSGAPAAWTLSLDAERLHLPALAASLGEGGFTRGTAAGTLRLSGGAGAAHTAGYGEIAVRGADIHGSAVMRGILSAIGLAKHLQLISRVDAAFAVEGHQLTLQSARLGQIGDVVPDVRLASGGVVDLATGDFDIDLIVIPAKRIREITGNLPVVDAAAALADNLTRFNVTGNWNRPDAVTARPRALRDLRELQPRLLQELLGTGQRLGDAATGALRNVLRELKGLQIVPR